MHKEILKIADLCQILEEYCYIYKENEFANRIIPLIETINFNIEEYMKSLK